jgi:hypothetical protein
MGLSAYAATLMRGLHWRRGFGSRSRGLNAFRSGETSMLKKLFLTAACAASMTALPAMIDAARAQEPPAAPTPSEATSSPDNGSMSKASSMSKGGSGSHMKKKHHSKKHKSM